MSYGQKTEIISVHPFRRSARKHERDLQAVIDATEGYHHRDEAIPEWAKGVRVRKAGFFQWAVEATENRGR